jgi:hypothetical protein
MGFPPIGDLYNITNSEVQITVKSYYSPLLYNSDYLQSSNRGSKTWISEILFMIDFQSWKAIRISLIRIWIE